jgi:hypothetical protein
LAKEKAMQEGNDSAVLQLELKYCEACGGLWFRRAGEAEVYCGRCAAMMAEIAQGKAGRHAH